MSKVGGLGVHELGGGTLGTFFSNIVNIQQRLY